MAFSLKRYYAAPDAMVLIGAIFASILGLTVFFDMLLPFWIGLVLAYLQQYPIDSLRSKMSYEAATITVFSINLVILIGLGILITPFIVQEMLHFLRDFPMMLDKAGQFLEAHAFFGVSLEKPLSQLALTKSHEVLGQGVSMAVEYAPSAIHILIYLVTIPVIVFFLNYDREIFLSNFKKCFPANRPVLSKIGAELCLELSAYVRGKVVHMVIIGLVSYALFWGFSLNFAALLSIPMALSVFIPFVGTALATIPLILIAYAQFGLSWHIFNLMMGYMLIQVWEANILVPMIFSQSNDLHPVTVLAAVLIFGSLGGLLGVFLAIPLAATIKVLIRNWPIEEQGEQ